jgi:hypothetical protein
MSIKDDIEALEKALQAGDKRDAQLFAYCTPDRIRRLLGALKEAERRPGDIATIGLALNASTEAKLSKALELLKGARDFPSDLQWNSDLQLGVAAFLKENGHE